MAIFNPIPPVSRLQPVKKTLGIQSRVGLKGAYRQMYSGILASEGSEPKVDPVNKPNPSQKYSDNAGVMGKAVDRVSQYKDEYRKYYLLEQALEDHYDEPNDDMDFADHLYMVLSDVNLVVEALAIFDKVFDTSYLYQVGSIIRHYEKELADATVLIHVDYTLGFFKGRLRKAYQAQPEAFDFFVESEVGFIPMMIQVFRQIKAVIPERIDEISSKMDRHGAVIDQKL